MGHRSSPIVRSAALMGTVASIHVHDDRAGPVVQTAMDAFLAEMERLEAMFSTFRPTSEISRVNRGELNHLDCSAEVIEVLDACTWLEHLSNGAFTVHQTDRQTSSPPRSPPGISPELQADSGAASHGFIDPAGFVKGWATERASFCLTDAGLEHWYVNVGGDVQTHGSPAPGAPWSVAIADPNHPGRVATVLDVVDDQAVATSGIAERGAHIWTADRSSTLASMTVAGPHLTWADAYATAAFAMGSHGVEWIAAIDGYEALAIDLDGHHTTTL